MTSVAAPALLKAPVRMKRERSTSIMENCPAADAPSALMSKVVATNDFIHDESEMDRWMAVFEKHCQHEFNRQMRMEVQPKYTKTTTFAFLDITPFCRNAMHAIVEDSFTKCFESSERVHWDNTYYLAPLQYMGILFRYTILFPFRILLLFCGSVLFAMMMSLAVILPPRHKARVSTNAVFMLNSVFLMSWCAVVMERGVVPPREAGQLYVTNHTTVIDVCIMMNRQLYAMTGQSHEGLIGFFQKYVLYPLHCVWFNRAEQKDRRAVALTIREHSMDLSKPPLLVFPEGTCVNNEYVLMFKQGAFEFGRSVVPVSIKYNKVFVDTYWHSRKMSFPRYLVRLMTAWAVVAEVCYLDPQYRRKGETSIQFATRVKDLIAKSAGIPSVPWNGMLKYFSPKPEYKANRQRIYARVLKERFNLLDHSPPLSPDPSQPGEMATDGESDGRRRDISCESDKNK
eukprot:m.89961 g.89961  ORF g.89961 m.89961 type:complete len:456 (-) comp26348_c0_seq4:350-1717(-)